MLLWVGGYHVLQAWTFAQRHADDVGWVAGALKGRKSCSQRFEEDRCIFLPLLEATTV